MPQYVSLQQQGFFEPFQAIGNALARTAHVLQQGQQTKLAQQELQRRKDEDALRKPGIEAQTEDLQGTLRDKKRARLLRDFDVTNVKGGLRQTLQPTDEDRAAFPNVDLGTGQTDWQPYSEKDLEGIAPEAQPAGLKRGWKPIDLGNLDFSELSPDLQRFTVAKYQEAADAQGLGQISPAEVAATMRANKLRQTGPTLGAGMQPFEAKRNEQTGEIETTYKRMGGDGNLALTPEERTKLVSAYGKEGDEAFTAYRAADVSRNVLAAQVLDAEQKHIAGKDADINDPGILLAYMRTLNPTMSRNPSTEEIANTSSIPESVVEAYLKALKGEKMTPEKRRDFLNLADKNVEEHRLAGAKHADSIAYRSGRQQIPSADYLDPKLIERKVTAPAPPKPTEGKPQFASAEEFEAAAKANNWPDKTQVYLTNPKTGKLVVATYHKK